MLDVTPNFTFDSFKARLPIFNGNVVKAVQALQREDFLALKAHIEMMPVKAPFNTRAVMVEVLSKSLVVAYRYYFNELTSRDLSFISHNVTVISLRQKAIDLSVQCRLLGTEK